VPQKLRTQCGAPQKKRKNLCIDNENKCFPQCEIFMISKKIMSKKVKLNKENLCLFPLSLSLFNENLIRSLSKPSLFCLFHSLFLFHSPQRTSGSFCRSFGIVNTQSPLYAISSLVSLAFSLFRISSLVFSQVSAPNDLALNSAYP